MVCFLTILYYFTFYINLGVTNLGVESLKPSSECPSYRTPPSTLTSSCCLTQIIPQQTPSPVAAVLPEETARGKIWLAGRSLVSQ